MPKWDDKHRRNQKEAMARCHSDPEYRKKQSERMRGVCSSPEWRKKNSESKKKRWSDPEQRKAQSVRMKKFCADNPTARKDAASSLEVRKRISEAAVRAQSDPEYRKSQSEKEKKYIREHPGCRKRTLKQIAKWKVAHKEFLATPEGIEYRKKHAAAISKWGKDRFEKDPESLWKFIRAGQHTPKWSDTKPELKMKAILEKLGVEYTHPDRISELKGRHKIHPWDFLIPSRKIAIEVDGCFWHGCQKCYPGSINPREDQELKRDCEAELSGWTVLRYWEHDLVDDRVLNHLSSKLAA